MKSVLIGIVLAGLLGAGAAYVMDTHLQRSVKTAHQTQGVRL